MGLSTEALLSLYYDMVLVRRFEETVDTYAKKGLIPGFLHLSIGQEACQVGAIRALKQADYKFPDHRSHGICLLAGSPRERVMAEIFGKKTGLCGGKGGSMHIADVMVGNMGNNAIQGSIMATGLGTAVAAQIKGTEQVTAIFIGDGTVGRGEFHESLNLAATWKLPIVYILVNNHYAISTHTERAHPVKDLVEMAGGYHIPGVIIDGNDVEAVYDAVTAAVARARQGEGPTLLELKTYRWQGHFSGDPAAYRPQEEVKTWKDRCPLKRCRERLLNTHQVAEAELQALERKAEEEITAMLAFTLASPDPAPADAVQHVYVGREVAGR
ncbi:thiamine pyrophosphate-dependent dehydrogenase E1 component subunit alpha [Moorella naiadis]|uniref:thiamine pyrophosphate-dependent dehydrogenase E1 component subunit alpha n=1 Tax=Moorella naiadis (nom. illeg.) TaxID=3093670 RepID=UPI003D9C88D2